jgi:predicted Rossmann fold nucleotide-binding protein DprA/Smf involved in DNA uptake
MTTQNKEQARQRTEMLTALRCQHSETFQHAQALLKEQQATRKKLLQAMIDGARSVPQLAESSGVPANVVLWHVAALKKYGRVVEKSLDEDGDYYLYELSKEAWT